MLVFAKALALATGVGMLSPSLLIPGVVDAAAELRAGDTAYVDVTVGTLWVKPDAARGIDSPSLGDPVDLDAWNRAMDTVEERRWLTGNLETQAVYGSEVKVKKVQGDWAQVTVTHQSTPRDKAGYPGWIPVTQLTEDLEFGREVGTRARAVVAAKKTTLSASADGSGKKTPLSFGTELPVLSESSDAVRVMVPGGGAAWLPASAVDVYEPGEKPPKPSGGDLVETGEEFLGLKYLWAGVSSYGFDCSGFTSAVFRSHGVSIPRDASAQFLKGEKVSSLKSGDLIFFATSSGSIHHVGMYMGGGKMIHSPNASKTVEIVDWKAWDEKNEYAGARRYI